MPLTRRLQGFARGDAVAGMALAVVLCGCSERGFVSVEPPNTLDDTETTELPPGCASDAVGATFELAYPSRQDCPWNEGGNLEPRNEFNQARVEEYRSIRLPEGAVVCELSLASQEQGVFFDDHLTMTLNDVVLVGGGSGYVFEDLELVDGLPVYEWSALAGSPFAERYAPYDCLGGTESVCQVPRTEETAAFNVEIAPPAMARLTSVLEGADSLRFGVITFGDDDGGDCAHSAVTLDVDLSYLAP